MQKDDLNLNDIESHYDENRRIMTLKRGNQTLEIAVFTPEDYARLSAIADKIYEEKMKEQKSMKNKKWASYALTAGKAVVLTLALGFYLRVIPWALENKEDTDDAKTTHVSAPVAIDSLNHEIAKRDSIIRSMQEKVK